MNLIVYRIVWILLIGLSILSSCSQSADFNESIYNLDMRSITNQQTEPFLLSDLAGDISYIPLETNDSCLLNRIAKVRIVNDNVFISDGTNLFQFALTGKFIRQIGRVGRGPGEHGRQISFAVDDVRREIYIFSTNIMNVYDLESGMYKRRFLISQDISDFYILPQGKIILFTYELPAEVIVSSICEVYLADLDGELVDSVPNYSRLNIKSNSRGYATTYESDNNEIRYLFNFRDTLYTITADFERSPYAVFKLDNKISRDNLIIEPVYDEIQHPDFLWIPGILENDQYLFITAEKGRALMIAPTNYHIVFHKESGRAYSTSGIKNDIDGGLTFWPRYIFDDRLISHHLPTEFIDHYHATGETVDHSEDYLLLVNSLDENDNPVLVIIE